MIFLLYVIIFIFGAAIGSFLGVIVDRLRSNEPIWKGRSHCDHCRHTLSIGDLIPLISFFLLGGKCRYCHKKLPWFYPLIELCTGITYVAIGLAVFHFSSYLFSQLYYQLLYLYYLTLVGALLVIFFTDLRDGIIPFKAVGFAFIVAAIWEFLLPGLPFTPLEIQLLGLHTDFFTLFFSALGTGGFFLCIFLVTKGKGMGFGDVVYAFLMGFLLGFPLILVGLYIAFVTGAIVSLLLIALKKRKFRGGTIPFGPFLVFGTILCLLWGNAFFTWFLHYFTY